MHAQILLQNSYWFSSYLCCMLKNEVPIQAFLDMVNRELKEFFLNDEQKRDAEWFISSIHRGGNNHDLILCERDLSDLPHYAKNIILSAWAVCFK